MAALAWPCSCFLGKNMPTAAVGMVPGYSKQSHHVRWLDTTPTEEIINLILN
jgi:hypothetical protein